MPDPRAAGLDPAHILGVCLQAISSAHSRSGRVAVLTASGQMRACLPSRRAALGATAMLIRVGYQVTRVGGVGRSDLLVTGWSAAGLEARLAAMRNVLHDLDASSLDTAIAAIERIRRLPSQPGPSSHAETLIEIRAQLRARVSARCGVRVPHDPAILPANRANALRLRTAWTLESAIDRLIDHQMRVAEDALSQFGHLRQYIGDDLARQAVLHSAGPAVHPDGSGVDASLAQDSSGLVQRAARPPALGLRFPAPQLRDGTPAGPVRQAASDFPCPVTNVITAADAAAAQPAHPGGRPFPASRPGLRR